MKYLKSLDWPKWKFGRKRAEWVPIPVDYVNGNNLNWLSLNDTDRGHLVSLLLLAGDTGNKIQWEPAWIAKRIHSTEPIQFERFAPWFYVEDEHGVKSSLDGTGEVSVPDAPVQDGASVLKARAFIGVWNETCTELPRARDLTPGRVAKICNRLESVPDMARWRVAMERLNRAPFARTTNAMNIDWLIRSDDSLIKLEEGKYDAKQPPPGFGVRKLEG